MVSATQAKYSASAELTAVTKKKKATRGDFLKGIWAYAKANELNTTKMVKGRNTAAINCDDCLFDVFGKKIVTAPEVMKGLSAHLTKA